MQHCRAGVKHCCFTCKSDHPAGITKINQCRVHFFKNARHFVTKWDWIWDPLLLLWTARRNIMPFYECRITIINIQPAGPLRACRSLILPTQGFRCFGGLRRCAVLVIYILQFRVILFFNALCSQSTWTVSFLLAHHVWWDGGLIFPSLCCNSVETRS